MIQNIVLVFHGSLNIYLSIFFRQQSQDLSDLTEQSVRSLPLERVRHYSKLLQPGQQCRICFHPFLSDQLVRKLPCTHKFHKDCIDNWLLHQRATCPLDGTVYTNESIKRYKQALAAR